MGKLRSSHFDTLIILGLILFSQSAAYPAVRCEDLFKPGFFERIVNLIPKKSKAEFSAAEMRDLKDILNYKRPYGMTRDRSDPIFIYMWNELSVSKRALLSTIFESAPKDFKKYRTYITELTGEVPSSSYVDVLLAAWGDQLRFNQNPGTFAEWIKNLNENFNGNLAELRERVKQGQRIAASEEAWKSAGVHQLTVKEDRILIGERWLKCKVDSAGKSIRILAPHDMVKRAAWNPLYTEVLIKKMGERPLSVYPGFIGADANFYLSDGNHRFAVDQRPEVWVELGYPALNSSLPITFDALGISQPNVEQKLQLMNGEISLVDLIGAVLAQKFFYH